MNNHAKLKTQIASGFFWMFLERISAQLVTFIISLLLARILFPKDYGLVAVAQIFINIANILVSHGLNIALIQQDEVDDTDYSTAFYATLVSTVIVYCIFYILAPSFSKWIHLDGFTSIFRVLSLRIIIGSLNTIQRAYVSKNYLFKLFFVSTALGTVVSAVVGIGLAIGGFGAWAIVGQYLTNVIIDSIVLWFSVKWRPIFAFSKEKLFRMVHFSWKIALAELFNEVYLEIRAAIIGKKYSANELAYFNRGKQFPQLFFSNIVSAIVAVIFPILSNEKKNYLVLRKSIEQILNVVSYLMFPLMMFLAVNAERIIKIILTDKWLPCVPFVKIYCLCYAFLPIQSILEQLYKALGRSDIVFELFLIEKTVGISLILATMNKGVITIAVGMLIASLFSTVVHTVPLLKVFDCSYIKIFSGVGLNAIMTSGVTIVAVAISKFITGELLVLLVQFFVFIITYFSVSYILKSQALFLLVQILRSICSGKIEE